VPVTYDEQEPIMSKALMPYINSDELFKKQIADDKARNNRQMVYGNLKLGNFDEEISGINLSKLFSVYGP